MSAGERPSQLDLFVAQEPLRGALKPPPAIGPPTTAPATTAPPDPLRPRLDRLLGGRLAELVLTRNRRRILSVRPSPRRPDALAVRLDACFADAPDDVMAAVAAWIEGEGERRRKALRVIRRHFEASRDPQREELPRRRRPVLRPVGCRLDLRALRDELNRAFFAGRLEVEITWGRAPTAGRRRRRRVRKQTIRLGSYCYETGVIRIHRALDHPTVPRYVVASVVYHEMLHAALPAPASNGRRRRLHPPQFRHLEARFPEHERARSWIDRHLDALLRRR